MELAKLEEELAKRSSDSIQISFAMKKRMKSVLGAKQTKLP